MIIGLLKLVLHFLATCCNGEFPLKNYFKIMRRKTMVVFACQWMHILRCASQVGQTRQKLDAIKSLPVSYWQKTSKFSDLKTHQIKLNIHILTLGYVLGLKNFRNDTELSLEPVNQRAWREVVFRQLQPVSGILLKIHLDMNKPRNY